MIVSPLPAQPGLTAPGSTAPGDTTGRFEALIASLIGGGQGPSTTTAPRPTDHPADFGTAVIALTEGEDGADAGVGEDGSASPGATAPSGVVDGASTDSPATLLVSTTATATGPVTTTVTGQAEPDLASAAPTASDADVAPSVPTILGAPGPAPHAARPTVGPVSDPDPAPAEEPPSIDDAEQPTEAQAPTPTTAPRLVAGGHVGAPAAPSPAAPPDRADSNTSTSVTADGRALARLAATHGDPTPGSIAAGHATPAPADTPAIAEQRSSIVAAPTTGHDGLNRSADQVAVAAGRDSAQPAAAAELASADHDGADGAAAPTPSTPARPTSAPSSTHGGLPLPAADADAARRSAADLDVEVIGSDSGRRDPYRDLRAEPSGRGSSEPTVDIATPAPQAVVSTTAGGERFVATPVSAAVRAPEGSAPAMQPAVVPQTLTRHASEMRQTGETQRRLVVRLDPPELGALTLEVQSIGDDIAVIARTDNAEATRALMRQRADMQLAIESLGMSLSDFDVQTGNGDEVPQRQRRSGSRQAASGGDEPFAQPQFTDDEGAIFL